MKKLKLFLLAAAMLLTVTGCGNDKPTSSEVPYSSTSTTATTSTTPTEPTDIFDNTTATSIDMVATQVSEVLGEDINAIHNDNGDYLVLNFGTTLTLDQLKTFTDTYCIPDQFEPDVDSWTVAEFEDDTACEYKDYIRENIFLEYIVYYFEGYGNILQVEAFELE